MRRSMDYCQWTKHFWLTSKDLHSSALYGHWVSFKGLIKSNSQQGLIARVKGICALNDDDYDYDDRVSMM